MKQKILFLCTHNSARSQMAEGLLRKLYGNRYDVFSAGIEPTTVNPHAIEVMKELNIDLSTHRSKKIDEFQGKTFDYVVTLCQQTKDACPFFPGKKILHKEFDDPSEFTGSLEETFIRFRRVRDEIKKWIITTFQ